jgi:predicted Fe-Mo cluster-binding NifX family protein
LQDALRLTPKRDQALTEAFQASKATKRIKIKKVIRMSKIVITSEGPSLDDQVDPRFGRAAGFVLVDLDTMDTQYIDNGQSQMLAQGAGIQASQIIARAGASWLLTGYVGPKAFKVLAAAGIKVGQNLEGLTVREVVERFKDGIIEMAQTANRAGR